MQIILGHNKSLGLNIKEDPDAVSWEITGSPF